jgi:hypothetical protein
MAGLGGSHHLPPYSNLCITPPHLHSNGTFSHDSQGGVSKLSRFGLSGLWQLITPCSDLRLGWGLKQTCSSPWELSNSVLHSTCTHRGRVDSRLLMVRSQTGNLTLGPSFVHKLCCRCPNGSCEAIFDIYASRPFQRYKEHFTARCFDPCNRALSLHFGNVSVIFTLFQSGVVTHVMWLSFAIDGSKQKGKWLEHRTLKWAKTNSAHPKGSPWQISMIDGMTMMLPSQLWWI